MSKSWDRTARGRFATPVRKCAIAAIGLLGLGGSTACQQEIQAGPSKAEFAAERTRLAGESARKVQASAKPSSAVSPIVESRVGTSFSYSAEGRRDPFRSMLYEIQEVEDRRTRAPLEQFELGQIALMGVVWEAEEPRALVTDPEGRSFVIRSGSRIGKNEGRVTHIGDNLVRVKETYMNYAGEQTRKDVELRIRRSQGG